MHKIKIGMETHILYNVYKEIRSLHHLFSIIREDDFEETNLEEDKTVTICRP